MYFSIVPPSCSMMPRTSANACASAAFIRSGPSLAVSAVEPTTSMNSDVTRRRSSVRAVIAGMLWGAACSLVKLGAGPLRSGIVARLGRCDRHAGADEGLRRGEGALRSRARGTRGGGLRVPRSQRRGQDDHDPPPHVAHAAD